MTASDWWFRSWWHQAARHGESATEAYASMMDALLAAPDSVRLELAALLNPWRPGHPPEYPDMITDSIEITKDGRWRYILPAAPQLEDKPK